MEQPQDSPPRKFRGSIQDYLSLGYLYLILLGVVSDSIFYGLLGINIMSYSSVLDILLSPIIHLTDSVVFPVVVIVLPLGSYYYLKLMRKIQEKVEARKGTVATGKLASLPHNSLWLFFTIFIIFSTFLGFGLGGGVKTKRILESKDYKTRHEITFQDGTVLPVKLIGNNSSYVFYVTKEQNAVIVSPMSGNVRKIEKAASAE